MYRFVEAIEKIIIRCDNEKDVHIINDLREDHKQDLDFQKVTEHLVIVPSVVNETSTTEVNNGQTVCYCLILNQPVRCFCLKCSQIVPTNSSHAISSRVHVLNAETNQKLPTFYTLTTAVWWSMSRKTGPIHINYCSFPMFHGS